MPFRSKRQQRAAFAGVIPGFNKEKALEWAHETPNLKKLPDRAPTEKGKPTLERKRRGKTAGLAMVELEPELGEVFKLAALGTAAMRPGNVGRLRGMMTTNALKAPGYAASTQANNPARNVIAAMNAKKPH